MTWGPGAPATPTAHTNITVPFYVTNIQEPLNHLHGMLPDPGAVDRVPVSTGLGASPTATWKKIPTAAIDDLAITNALIAASTIDLNAKAADGSLTNVKIAANTINLGTKSVANSLTSAQMAVGAAVGNITAGTITAAMLASGAALSNLGYTPANVAGTTFTGQVLVQFLHAANAPLALWQQHTGGPSVVVLNAVGGAFDLFMDHTAALFGIPVTSSTTVTGSQLVASIADGTTSPLTIHANQANVAVPNLKAAKATLADSATTATSATSATSATTATTATTANGVAALSVTDAGIATANKDGAAGTPSMRTLGTGAAQAAAGNHAHTNMPQMTSGTYVGDGTGSQSIALGISAKVVFITQVTDSSNGIAAQAISGKTYTSRLIAGTTANLSDSSHGISGTNFTASTSSGTNSGSVTYSWVAFT